MSKNDDVSILVVRRLPRYYRFLCDLFNKGISRISSKSLAERMGLTASQIRQDLNCFGGFGQQGYGYNVEVLIEKIGAILGLANNAKTILIGAGNVGKMLLANMNFSSMGFSVVGIFDNNPSVIGNVINGIEILHIDKLPAFCEENLPTVAVLSIPSEAAQDISDVLVGLGVKGFWNFTYYDLTLRHSDITVENVHLDDYLMTLSYRINNK